MLNIDVRRQCTADEFEVLSLLGMLNIDVRRPKEYTVRFYC